MIIDTAIHRIQVANEEITIHLWNGITLHQSLRKGENCK